MHPILLYYIFFCYRKNQSLFSESELKTKFIELVQLGGFLLWAQMIPFVFKMKCSGSIRQYGMCDCNEKDTEEPEHVRAKACLQTISRNVTI